MIKVLQYGEGNFLRTFVDAYFNTLNKESLGDYGVYIVKPINFGTLDKFAKQNNKYNIVLRGVENGEDVEKVYEIDAVKEAIDPFIDYEKYMSLAKDPELKIVVSNTTEAGICYNENDKMNGFDGITYPAKLTKFLYERFAGGLDGLYILPVELIDNNADELAKCVDKYISLWNLPEEFAKWNSENNFYCNTLVDRIVSGNPKDDKTRDHIYELLGKKDELVSIGEVFGLWAVEDKGEISKYIHEGSHNIDVVLTKNIGYYKKRKVRVLNGSHTNLVPAGLFHGKETVYDCMKDEKLYKFLDNTLEGEIIPFVSDDIAATTEFADSVKERFFNPFLNHMLISISLNSISKWRARNLCSFKDYYEKNGAIPKNLTIGFSYLLAIFSVLEKENDAYFANIAGKKLEIKDDKPNLEYFVSGGTIEGFMKDTSVWGEDLTEYKNFYETVKENVGKILNGEDLL